MVAALRAFGHRHRYVVAFGGAALTIAALVYALSGRRHDFATALAGASWWILAATAGLQTIALVSRSEAWHLTIEAAGGRIARRVLFRASSMQGLGSLLNGQLGVAARIVTLRRSSCEDCPKVPTLIASEVPILAVEATLAAAASFTLIGPLNLPWWSPLIALAVIVARRRRPAAARALPRPRAVARAGRDPLLARRPARGRLGPGRGVCQIFRNWMLLHAVGVDASFFDAIAVLIAVVTLGQLPVGPAVGAAAAVLILGSEGVAATAAAGVLMTATGTAGALVFLVWAGADRLWARLRPAPAPVSAG